MASSYTKWDIDQLNAAVRSLATDYERIAGYRDSLKNLGGTVAAHWQSPAGRQYLARLDTDVENLDKILSKIADLTLSLEKVSTTCYTTCEEEVSSKLQRLSSSIA